MVVCRPTPRKPDPAVAALPIDVGTLGAQGVAGRAQLLQHLVEKFWGPVL